MLKNLSMARSYFFVFTGILHILLICFGFVWIQQEHERMFIVSVLAIILFLNILAAKLIARRARGEFEALRASLKLGAMMSINTSRDAEINANSFSLKEFRELAESASKMFSDVGKARKALQESEEKYRSFVEHTSDGIIIVQSMLVKYINPVAASMIGCSVEETIGTPFTRCFVKTEAAKLLENYNAWLEGRSISEIFETHAKPRNGPPLDLELKADRIMFRGMPAVLLVARDITARKREEVEKQKLKAQIQQAQKLESLGLLAGGVAHDFNNLLMGIMGNAALLRREHADSAVSLKRISAIETSSERAAELTRQLLAYSGKGRFVVKPLDLSNLVEEMANLLDASISKKAELSCDFMTDLPSIEADATQMRQVVMNLITNASEAMGDQYGLIKVSTGCLTCSSDFLKETCLGKDLPVGPYVYVRVSDTGCGMDQKTLQRIFDPFFTTKFTGRGLGLAAVLGIVRAHKGTLKVESYPGRGTDFTVLFPASDKPAEMLGKKEYVDIEWRGDGTVLVVDDEPEVRAVVEEILELSGFRILSAKDGIEAVEVFRNHKDEVGAVVLDMTMPGLDGKDTFRELRKIQDDVKVVISSGYNEQDIAERFRGVSIAGFIHKPYTSADLVRTMRDVLEKETCANAGTV